MWELEPKLLTAYNLYEKLVQHSIPRRVNIYIYISKKKKKNQHKPPVILRLVREYAIGGGKKKTDRSDCKNIYSVFTPDLNQAKGTGLYSEVTGGVGCCGIGLGSNLLVESAPSGLLMCCR